MVCSGAVDGGRRLSVVSMRCVARALFAVLVLGAGLVTWFVFWGGGQDTVTLSLAAFVIQ